MALRVGIVGPPTLACPPCSTNSPRRLAEAANYPFCTIKPNVGVVGVPDKRLERLGKLADLKEVLSATIKFVDIACLIVGALKGEGFVNHRGCHRPHRPLLRGPNCGPCRRPVNPARGIEVIETKLLLKDLDTTKKRVKRAQKAAKTGQKDAKTEVAFYERLSNRLGNGKPACWALLDASSVYLKSHEILQESLAPRARLQLNYYRLINQAHRSVMSVVCNAVGNAEIFCP